MNTTDDLTTIIVAATEEGEERVRKTEAETKAKVDRIMAAIQAEGYVDFALALDTPGAGGTVGYILNATRPAFVLRLYEATRMVLSEELLCRAAAACGPDEESVH